MKRSAPDAGYDFGNKRQYRRTIWAQFRRACVNDLANAQALLMPSAEGDEIEVALSNGFREYNLHVVDKNPAIVAHLKRRFRRINTYGVRVDHAAQRIAKSGTKLSVANLDFCSQVSRPLLNDLRQFMSHQPMRPNSLISVTAQRGREQKGHYAAIRSVGELHTCFGVHDNDLGRTLLMSDALSVSCAADEAQALTAFCVREGVYRSVAGNLTMLWAVFRMRAMSREDLFRLAASEASSMGISVKDYLSDALRLSEAREVRHV